jgi:hypothetical protein
MQTATAVAFLKPSTGPSRRWLAEQVACLAAAFGLKELEEPRLKAYVEFLSDLDVSQIQTAVTRAARELKFFPQISELRELVGRGTERECGDVEANAAFQAVIQSLERNGVDAGLRHLPARTQFAVRQCGGLFQFNQRLQIHYGDDDNPSHLEWRAEIFLRKDFIAAYRSYSVHESMLPELTEKGLSALPEPVRRFLGDGQKPTLCGGCGGQIKTAAPPAQNTALRAKHNFRIPEPPTPAQIRDRREILRQQAELLKTKKSAEGAA